jgi:hypothetical protein
LFPRFRFPPLFSFPLPILLPSFFLLPLCIFDRSQTGFEVEIRSCGLMFGLFAEFGYTCSDLREG